MTPKQNIKSMSLHILTEANSLEVATSNGRWTDAATHINNLCEFSLRAAASLGVLPEEKDEAIKLCKNVRDHAAEIMSVLGEFPIAIEATGIEQAGPEESGRVASEPQL